MSKKHDSSSSSSSSSSEEDHHKKEKKEKKPKKEGSKKYKGFTLHNVAQNAAPPKKAVHGHQTDGAGEVFVAVAHTQWGDIPAKAKGNTCWFPYGGKEHATNNFSWVTVRKHKLVKGTIPPRAVSIGNQTDGAGTLYAAIAHTPHGEIPGKAKDNNCWYSYGGAEHVTHDFSWIAAAPLPAYRTVNHTKKPVPPKNVPAGNQTDGAGTVWCAIAHTQWGEIPGKAKDNTCWFPYGGAEHATNNFSWVRVQKYKLVKSTGKAPDHSVPAGNQTDGAGTLWVAVAHTPHGNIPGKAKDNTCWYSYGGKEHATNDFSYVISG